MRSGKADENGAGFSGSEFYCQFGEARDFGDSRSSACRRFGVTVQAIARTASLATLGDNEANLAKFNLPDRQIPIRVQIEPKARDDIDTIRNLQVPGQNNTLVPLVRWQISAWAVVRRKLTAMTARVRFR
jgi:multidrug efflux pump subunit AcrB